MINCNPIHAPYLTQRTKRNISPFLSPQKSKIQIEMACLAQQFTGLRCPPISSSRLSKPFSPKQPQKPSFVRIVSAVAISNAQTKERLKLKEMFEDAYERCRTAPTEGVSFSADDFYSALDKYDFNSEIGTKVGGPPLLFS